MIIVVVGGGIAGVSCAEQLVLSSPDYSVILISASPLVKACSNIKQIAKVLEEFQVQEKDASYLEAQYPRIKVIQSSVIGLKTERKELYLSNVSTIHYDKLCICSGGKPKLIADGNPLVLGIRDTETVQVFHEKLVNARRIAIIGNGGIATELVYELKSCEVMWVIKDKSIGAAFFDAGAAEFFMPHLSEHRQQDTSYPIKRIMYKLSGVAEPGIPRLVQGSALGPDWSTGLDICGKIQKHKVHIKYECDITHIHSPEEVKINRLKITELEDSSESDWPIYVELSNGQIFGCDFVVSATGVIPCTTPFLDNNKFQLAGDGGLIVDTQMRTSVPDVYAAGDVCTAGWEPSKNWLQMRLWTQARQMGMYAAQCIVLNTAGEENVLDICFDLFTHVTRFFGYKVILLGLFNCQTLGRDCELLLRITPGKEYIKLVLQCGKVQGAILIGDTDLEETFENLILNGLDVSSLGVDLLNPDVDIEDYFD